MSDQTPHETENERLPSDHVGVLLAAGIMAVGGWGGLYLLVTSTLPRVGERWLFFMLLLVAITGTVLPLVRFLNQRFTRRYDDPPPGGVLVRQSVWIGLFVVTCAWLQIPRVLNPPTAFFVALAFIIIEVFLRSRELAQDAYDD